MERAAKTLILGIALGAAGVVLALRLKQLVDERDPDSLVDKIAGQIEDLESRLLKQSG